MSTQINVPDYILLEDEWILVINKPAGLMVEPDRNGHPNLLQQVKKYLKNTKDAASPVYAQHLHRLDRPVSGVILFAKQREVLKNLSEQFAQRQVKKYYQAITEFAPTTLAGQLDHWHTKDKKNKRAIVSSEHQSEMEKATLSYRVKQILDDRFQWDIDLHSGKYHQIRAQLSAVGCPILGDSLYGSRVPFNLNAIALHASKLVFKHPATNEEIEVESSGGFTIPS